MLHWYYLHFRDDMNESAVRAMFSDDEEVQISQVFPCSYDIVTVLNFSTLKFRIHQHFPGVPCNVVLAKNAKETSVLVE